MKEIDGQTYWVDIPRNPKHFDLEDQEFENVAEFTSREAAIEYCKEKFGADDNGNICLITPS